LLPPPATSSSRIAGLQHMVAVEIVDGAHDYLDWITEVTTGTGP
jgi:hypothetical protein